MPKRKSRKPPAEETTETSEVDSDDDLTSSSDDSDDSDSESSFDSELNVSESLTECEFTDSEGRPNPFHKQMEVPSIVVGSPNNFDSVPPPGQRIYPNSASDDEVEYKRFPSPSYKARYQYKTPNVSDRLKKTEESVVKAAKLSQARSTQRALNLKKNWVSYEAQNNGFGSRKVESQTAKDPVKNGQTDDRLQSLMDRLSSQQSLLKPAAKPSSQMEHFLKKTTSVNSSMNIKSPLDSPPVSNNDSKFRTPLYSSIRPPLTSSLSCQPISPPVVEPVKKVVESTQKYTEMESIPVPEAAPLPAKEEEQPSSAAEEVEEKEKVEEKPSDEDECAKVDFDEEDVDESEEEIPETKEEETEESVYRSCLDEEAEEAKDEETGSYHTPGKDLDDVVVSSSKSLVDLDQTPADSPLAMSSPLEVSKSASSIKREESPTPPPEPKRNTVRLTADELITIYKERNPSERLAKLNSLKRKQSSVIHDMLSTKPMNSSRASSKLRSRVPISPGGPPPIPPQETQPTTPVMPPKTLALDFPLIDDGLAETEPTEKVCMNERRV